MHTFFIVTTKREKTINGYNCGRDFAVFDYLPEVEKFLKGEPCYNAMDDSTRLYNTETINKVFCILATDIVSAYNRAYDLCQR